MANLFTSQTPAITDASDGTPGITTATTLVFAVNGTVTGVRFYATATVGGTYTAGLWTVDSSDAGTGTLLASKTMGGAPTGGTWNTVTFTDEEDNPTPVSVTTGVAYRVGIFSGAGRYVATVAFADFAGGSGGLTNGDIFAPPNNDNPVGAIVIKQGAFTIDAAFAYPTGGSGGTCYFVDVEFTAAGDDPVSPNGLAVTVALGEPAVGINGVTPNGLDVAAALGEPVIGINGVTPNGLGVAVALGEPTVTLAAAAPNGLGVAAALGEPAIPYPGIVVTPDGLGAAVGLGSPAIVYTAGPSGLAVTVELGAPTVGQAAGSTGWSDFGGIIQGAINDAAINAERRRNPIECPEHGWPLEITARGRHCQFGGHVVSGGW